MGSSIMRRGSLSHPPDNHKFVKHWGGFDRDDTVFGKSYEEGRNGGLPGENSKSRFLKANRRFFLPPFEPK